MEDDYLQGTISIDGKVIGVCLIPNETEDGDYYIIRNLEGVNIGGIAVESIEADEEEDDSIDVDADTELDPETLREHEQQMDQGPPDFPSDNYSAPRHPLERGKDNPMETCVCCGGPAFAGWCQRCNL